MMKPTKKLLGIAVMIVLISVTLTLEVYAKEIMTRAEFCTFAVNLYEDVTGKTITERVKFTDTTDANVEKAAAAGIVTGVGNGRFDPEGELTREQAAVILARLAAAAGKPIPAFEAVFSDIDSVSPWALAGVGQVQGIGIMSGTGADLFSPKDNYCQEQAAITLLRLFDYLTLSKYTDRDYALQVKELINIERAKAGLDPLIWTEELHAAATVRAGELPLSFSHYRPDGSACFTVLDEFNIVSTSRGENIAGNFKTPEQVVAAWLSSENHRKYILGSAYTDLGVGVFTDSSGKLYWSLFFVG